MAAIHTVHNMTSGVKVEKSTFFTVLMYTFEIGLQLQGKANLFMQHKVVIISSTLPAATLK